MQKELKENLLKVFENVLDSLPENFDELFRDSGSMDIDLELYSIEEEKDDVTEPINECIEKFTTEIVLLEDNCVFIEGKARSRIFYEDNNAIESLIEDSDLDFSDCLKPPFEITV